MNNTENNPTGRQRLSPMNAIRNLLGKLRSVHGRRMEHEIIETQVEREMREVGKATDEARRIEFRWLEVKQRLDASLVDAQSPGFIDRNEANSLAALLQTAGGETNGLRCRLEALA